MNISTNARAVLEKKKKKKKKKTVSKTDQNP